jgi:hypothetical protein
MGAEAIGDVSQDLRPVLQLDPVHAVGKRLDHDPIHELGALGHELRLYQTQENPQSRAPFVSTTGPFSVIATVCSKYAEREPSAVQIVQPSGFM